MLNPPSQLDTTQVTVVIVARDCEPAQLSRTLDSLAAQTLGHDELHVVLVNADSGDQALTEYLDALGKIDHYRAMTIDVLGLDQEFDPIAARKHGLLHGKSRYALFLNPGDHLDREFLKKAALVLSTEDQAGWIYPARMETPPRNRFVAPEPFSPLRMFFRPCVTPGALYRREDWLSIHARMPASVSGITPYDDWHTQIRLMSRGHIGIPLRECVHYCDWQSLDVARRTTKLHLVATYLTLQANLVRLPLLWRARSTSRKAWRKGWGHVSIFHPMWLPDKLQARLAGLLGFADAPATLGGKLLFLAAFFPKRFVKAFLDPEKSITLAELRCEFFRKPDLDFPLPGSIGPVTNTILFGQTNWTIGGSERVLQKWMLAARQATEGKIIDVCERETNRIPEVGSEYVSLVRAIREEFAGLCDEQYSLESMAETPLQRARICWELICRERPKLIYISGNAYLYALLPAIKKAFPDTVVVDILHNEWHNQRDWFNVSSEYARHIDERVTISEHWRDILIDKYDERYAKIHVFNNPIDLVRFDPDAHRRDHARARLGIRDDERVIAFVGRLQEQKNPAVFFELARRFESIPGYRFLVVGDGPERKHLLSIYGRLRNLTYVGPSNDVPTMIAASDLLVFCSLFEGYPLTSLEAAAMNVPIVAPAIVGFKEQIEAGGFGMLYAPSGNADVDAECIHGILSRQWEQLMALGARGRAFVQQHHDHGKLQDQYVAFLRQRFLSGSRQQDASPSDRPRRLYLHIGMHKTGSTSIQYFLHANRALLHRQGVDYPEEQRYGYAHHPLAWLCLPHARFMDPLKDKYATREAWVNDLNAFRDRLKASRYDRIILSSETFADTDPAKVAEYFRDFDTRIIVYLRRQDLYLESSYNQNRKMKIKTRRLTDSADREQYLDWIRPKLDYLALLDAWARHFGAERITVVPFEGRCFPLGLERGFIDLAGMKWDKRFATQRMNAGLSRDCVEYLAESDLDEKLDKTRYREIVDILETYSEAHPSNPLHKHAYPPRKRAEILDSFREGNSEIARRYLGRQDGMLFETPAPGPDEAWTAYPGLASETRRSIDAYLVEHGIPEDVLIRHAPSPSPRPAKRKTVLIHIGMHKTGSTTIQHFLNNNRDLLRGKGILYPDTHGGAAHHLIASLTYADKSSRKAFPRHARNKYANEESWKNHMRARIQDILSAPQDTVLLSSERFEFSAPEELVSLFPDTSMRILVFVRRQDERIESQFNQNLKRRLADTTELLRYHEKAAVRDYDRLRHWEDVLGAGNVIVLPFETGAIKDGLERTFMRAFGLEWDNEYVLSDPANRRLSRDCIAFLQTFFPDRQSQEGYFPKLKYLLENYTAKHPDPPHYKYFFPPKVRLDILERCRESNERVARHFLGRADGILFHDPEPSPDDPWEPYPGLSDAARDDILNHLLEAGVDLRHASASTHSVPILTV